MAAGGGEGGGDRRSNFGVKGRGIREYLLRHRGRGERGEGKEDERGVKKLML